MQPRFSGSLAIDVGTGEVGKNRIDSSSLLKVAGKTDLFDSTYPDVGNGNTFDDDVICCYPVSTLFFCAPSNFVEILQAFSCFASASKNRRPFSNYMLKLLKIAKLFA